MLARIMAVTIKELRQLARDKLTFGMIVGIPLMQMLLFGYAINFDVRGLRAAFVDQAGTSGSRALLGDLQASGVVRFLAPSPDVTSLQRRMNAGEINVGVVVPPESTIAMFAGAFFFWLMNRMYGAKKESTGYKLWVDTQEPICAGIIAGAALIGIGDVLVRVFLL